MDWRSRLSEAGRAAIAAKATEGCSCPCRLPYEYVRRLAAECNDRRRRLEGAREKNQQAHC
jgi:hypothetical protein